jgi:hypothetical protein
LLEIIYEDAKPIVTEGAISKTKVKDFVLPDSLKLQNEKNKQIQEEIKKNMQ